MSADRIAKWLVGDRLSCVLHLGDAALAYRLNRQGHEVVVAGDDVRSVRDPDIQYVRVSGDRLPFAAEAFDAVIAPDLRDSPAVLAEYARVLRPGGLVSTVSRIPDETIPWLRKLYEAIGAVPERARGADTFTASGLFDEPDIADFAAWEELDLAGLIAFARAKRPGIDDASVARVRELFTAHASGTGSLRLRYHTHGVRAEVDKSSMTPATETPDTYLFEFR